MDVKELIAKSKAHKVDMLHCIVCDCDISSTCDNPPGPHDPGIDFFTIIVPYYQPPADGKVHGGRMRRSCAACFKQHPEIQQMWCG